MVRVFQLDLENVHHYPGSIVRGRLLVTVDKPKKYHSIVVHLWGAAVVSWQVTHNKQTYTLSNSETYMSDQITVWQPNSPTGILPAGEHCYNFQFQISSDARSTFGSKYGQIKYEVGARIYEKSGLIWSSVVSKHAIKSDIVVKDERPKIDMLRNYSNPATAERVKRLKLLVFRAGSISASINIPRTGFSPGEVIPISVHLNNRTSRQIQVITILKRIDTFTESKGTHIQWKTIVAQTLSSPIAPRSLNMTYKDRNLRIPSNAYETLRNCSCINVEYALIVTIKIPWSFNKTLQLPIVVANGNSMQGLSANLLPQQAAVNYFPSYNPQPPVAQQDNDLDMYLPSYSEAVGNL